MDTDTTRAWLSLCRAPGIGGATVRSLLHHFADADAVLRAPAGALRAAGLRDAQIAALRQPDESAIARDLDWLSRPGCRLLTLDDSGFPSQLRELPGAPPMLFVQGDADWLSFPQVAVVGARSASAQGMINAEAFAAELARRGLVVTSGLALGIDGAAHRGALDAGGGTVAVCGTGLDRVYPARHKALAQQIARHGVLVSEFPTGTGALAEHFPRRNRIISGLSMGVLVVEAARDSGSLITARLALEQGREVFAIPGSIHNPLARGCHALIRQGAKLVETVDDVLEELGPLLGTRRATLESSRAAQPETAPSRPPEHAGTQDPLDAALLDALGDDVVAVDELAERTRRPIAELQAALTGLELAGEIAVAPGGAFQRLRCRT